MRAPETSDPGAQAANPRLTRSKPKPLRRPLNFKRSLQEVEGATDEIKNLFQSALPVPRFNIAEQRP